ncbi:MAG: acyltransferase [Anaerolineales bacterium]|nr:acyltransferase [Anaerolineales bacterium]
MHRGLTTFRFFAFLVVFLAHFNWDLFGFGYIGVQAFFVLSGFLLIPILLQMKTEMPIGAYFKSFYGRRILRIFPLYYGYLAGLLLAALLLKDKNISQMNIFLEQLPWALSYCYDFFHASVYFEHSRFLTHFWSLAVEEQFYLAWPVMILFIPPRHFKTFLFAVILAGPVQRFLIVRLYESGFLQVMNQRIDLAIYVLPFSHFDAFATGGLLALYGKSCNSNLRVLLLIAFTILLGYQTQYLSSGQISWQSLGYLPFMKQQMVWGYSLLNYIFALLFVQIRDERLLPKFFNNPVVHYLGKISYGLYVFHFGIQWFIWNAFPNLSGYLSILLSFISTTLLSSISYEFYEKRFIGMKDRYFPRKNLLAEG